MTLVRMFGAQNGDSFLIREGSSKGSASILIDGGYGSTFQKDIQPELAALHAIGDVLDLLVVTHIDEDHIAGVIALIEANKDAAAPLLISVKNVWHNSLRSILPTQNESMLSSTDQQILAAISTTGYSSTNNESPTAHEVSARQGSSLAALLRKYGYTWNNGDGHTSINSSTLGPYAIAGTMKVHVLGPTGQRLDELRSDWIRSLRRVGLIGKINSTDAFDDAFEFLCASDSESESTGTEQISHSNIADGDLCDLFSPDNSPTNASSISLIVETATTRMLFLGDAWSDDMEKALAQFSVGGAPVLFDAIKISHHGSLRNTSVRLLELIDAPLYFISTNGAKHQHPDYPVMKAIVDRPSKFERQLHFNYSTPASRQLKNYRSKSGTRFSVHENSTGWIQIEGTKHD